MGLGSHELIVTGLVNLNQLVAVQVVALLDERILRLNGLHAGFLPSGSDKSIRLDGAGGLDDPADAVVIDMLIHGAVRAQQQAALAEGQNQVAGELLHLLLGAVVQDALVGLAFLMQTLEAAEARLVAEEVTALFQRWRMVQ